MILLSILIIADEIDACLCWTLHLKRAITNWQAVAVYPSQSIWQTPWCYEQWKNISIQHREMRSFSVSMWRRGPCSCCTWTRASVMGFTVLRCANSPSARSYIHGPPGFTHTHACTFGERENVWNVKFIVAKSHDLEKNMGNFTKVICSITPKHAGVN